MEGCSLVQIATVDISSGTHLPHNRCQIFRKLLEPKSKPNLPLLLTTTDIRTPKVDQMVLNPNVEVVWWIEGEKKQWRVNGNISIIPTPSHPLHRNFQSQWEAHRDIISGLDALRNDQFDWPTQRLETFKSFSVRMRASFCRPVPGSKLTEDATKWPQTVVDPSEFEGSEEEKQQNQKNWDEAFGNFALVVVDPLEVDYLDMDVVPNRRWRQWVQGGMWMEEEIVP
ncbi:pyridoxamine 5'-phosphate oxidase-domain-containing protein [Flagelloscypha sp. PMI_526]|nr:pyridoxamine 5'-phosphate oxidase-domain-containing protein [Flagelloscypha sp. PMI_526]